MLKRNLIYALTGATSGLALGFQMAAAEPADPRAAYVENTIRAICTNPAKPLVVDTFASSTGDMFTTVRHVVGGTAPNRPPWGLAHTAIWLARS